MSPEAVQILGWFIGTAVIIELVERMRHIRRRNEAHRGCYEKSKPSFADVLWVFVAGGLHYATLAFFVMEPMTPWTSGFAQLPFVPVLVVPGCVLAAAGLALIIWSHRTLGLAFCISAAPTPGRGLVTTGPYRFVRHPIYLALVLKAIGVAIATSNLLVIATSVAMLIGIAIRIPGEERRLRQCYGAEWDDYASRTPALFPTKFPRTPSA